MAQFDVCGSCGAEIVWLAHARTHKPAPINVAIDRAGNILVDLTAGTYSIVPPAEREIHREWLRTNHFQTCPQAKTWAKSGGRRS